MPNISKNAPPDQDPGFGHNGESFSHGDQPDEVDTHTENHDGHDAQISGKVKGRVVRDEFRKAERAVEDQHGYAGDQKRKGNFHQPRAMMYNLLSFDRMIENKGALTLFP